MRLSTSPQRERLDASGVIHAALDGGVRLLDTADSYCFDEAETGHNERLIAAALRSWSGDRSTVEVATKGGLTRPEGRWVPDGRAKRLVAACEASLAALQVSCVDLYQLHVVDPRTPIQTSVRALAKLQARGLVRRIGLCNVTVSQLEAAREIAEIASVQVSVSPLDDRSIRNGVVDYCREHGIRILGYRPLGGERAERLGRDPVLGEIAGSREAQPLEVALAWLCDLGIIPLPGATRAETARSIGRAARIVLTEEDRALLDRRFPAGQLVRRPKATRRPPPNAEGEVVLVMGIPGAGKTELAEGLVARGFGRLNRDREGGSLSGLVPELARGLASGHRRWVLDNTYPTRRSRSEVIECAWAAGTPVRCVWLRTGIADAQINAIQRLLRAHGRLPTPEEIRERGRRDHRYFGPDAQFRYQRALEPPVMEEGFAAIETVDFVRRPATVPTGRALVVEFDGGLVRSASGAAAALDPDDLVIPPDRRAVLARYLRGGWKVFAQAWRPHVGLGEIDAESVERCFQRAGELLGQEIEFGYCPHRAGPPVCWCRKPLPGLALGFSFRHQIALGESVVVGRGPADRTLADRLGARYQDATEFFGAD
jgi:aryl-alcohol dehydrogenase-like predicted oxidoreductase